VFLNPQASFHFYQIIFCIGKKEMSILKVENLSKSFGGIHANQDISFEVQPGEILGVIGPNGAGKSTLFDLITGFTKPDKGSVIFQDQKYFWVTSR
jgi:branched-chain amino acid transport system ATP-binding protein